MNPEYKEALVDLLYQLADDDLLVSYRGSEWLGLVPHIEEDVAYSSITQNIMGHAAMYYQLLEEIGVGKVDDLAQLRPAKERKNAIILELANGTGHWLYNEPRYDWAFTVVRNFFYETIKKIKIDSLKNSTYTPLAQMAIKIDTEALYHLMHWRTWFQQLITAGGEAETRMKAAVEKVWKEIGGVLSLGPNKEKIASQNLIESEKILKERFLVEIKGQLAKLGLELPGEPGMESGDGRAGVHTTDLENAILTLSEVYSINPAVPW